MLLHLHVLGSHIKALAVEVVLLPIATWLLSPRHPIQTPTTPMSLCPQVVPHEGTKPLSVPYSLHVVVPVMLVCCCYPCVLIASIPF